MALTVAKGASILVKLGDGANPEVFAHPCMINTSRSISFDAATSSDMVEDCVDTDNPATTYNFKSSKSISIDGAGKLDAADIDTWIAKVADPDPVNVKIIIGDTTVTVPMMVTKFAITGEPHKYAEVSVSMVSHGAWTVA